MVRLDRIYTRSGDDGTTGLGDGKRIAKHHPRVAAYGTVDELSAVIGLSLAYDAPEPFKAHLRAIQNDLLDVGADLAVPGEAGARLRITADYVTRLEKLIDEVNAPIAPLKSFVLPGGRPHAAWMHLGRNVCRRAERLVCELLDREEEGNVNPEVLHYLNRLSDLLFVFAHALNDGGNADVLWEPGKGRS
jgi:cob(I)alamin adenosyltransferase